MGTKHKRNKIHVYVHFVWATWDRLPLVTAEIERDVYRYIETISRDNKCEVFAVNGMPDHIHLLVALHSTISLSELMQRVKGGSSRYVTDVCKPVNGLPGRATMAHLAFVRRTSKPLSLTSKTKNNTILTRHSGRKPKRPLKNLKK